MDAMVRNRRLILALLAAGLAAPGVVRAAEPAPASPRPPPLLPPTPGLPEAQFTPDDGDTDLLGMEDMLRRMTAPVMVDGQGPFDFVVDTGTNRSVISDTLAARLELPAGRPVRLHGINSTIEAPTARLKSLQVGVRTARNLSLPILPARAMRGAGILGVDGLKKQRVVLDLHDQRLLIEPSSKADYAEGTAIKTRRRFGQLTVVDTDLNGVQVSVLVDTGAEVSVGNSALRRVLDTRRYADPAGVQRVALEGATGELAYGDYGGIPQFRIGALRIGNMRLVYADLHPFALWDLQDKPAILLGMDVLRFFDRVAIDFGRNEIRFTLPEQPFIDPASEIRRF
jgi:predicted aspartyl protease